MNSRLEYLYQLCNISYKFYANDSVVKMIVTRNQKSTETFIEYVQLCIQQLVTGIPPFKSKFL